jgi:type II secretory pathway component PulK
VTAPPRGFVLPLTLWVLAAMTLVIGVFAERMLGALELAKASQRRVEGSVEISETRAEILFRLGTTPLTVFGLGPLGAAVALDDRPYRGDGRSVVRLQDARGLLNLNLAGDERIRRLLGVLDVPFEQRGPLADALADYIDEDDFRRLNGAEKREYLAEGLPPPRNDRLLTPYEARNVLGWSGQAQLWRPGGLADLATTSLVVALNPATAPWQVLATLPGMSNDLAQKITAIRANRPLQGADEIAELLGVSGGSLFMQVITFPSDTIRVTHGFPGQSHALRYNVTLTPFGENSPWQIDYHYTFEGDRDESSGMLGDLPEKAALPANTGTPLSPFR